MAIQYRQIDELPRKDALAKDDMFLVATTNATELGYITYNTTFETLSSKIVSDSQNLALSHNLVTTRGNLNNENSSLCAVAANVVYIIDSDLTTIKNNYVSKNNTEVTNVNGSVVFNQAAKSQTVNISDTVPVDDTTIVNVHMLRDYVAQKLNQAGYPLFTTLICKTDLDGQTFILADVLPQIAKSTSVDRQLTLIVKFKDVSNSTTNRTMSFTFNENGTAKTPTNVVGDGKTYYKNATTGTTPIPAEDHTRWYAKVHFTLAKNVEPFNISWTIDNINASIDVSMAIYNGHV